MCVSAVPRSAVRAVIQREQEFRERNRCASAVRGLFDFAAVADGIGSSDLGASFIATCLGVHGLSLPSQPRLGYVFLTSSNSVNVFT